MPAKRFSAVPPTGRRSKRLRDLNAEAPSNVENDETSSPVVEPPDFVDEDTPYTTADAYRIMRAKHLYDGFASAQIESFNDFVHVKIPKCLSEHPPVVVVHEPKNAEYIVEILGVRYDRPSVRESTGEHRYVTPHECHIRRLNYMFNMLVTARYMIRQRDTGKIIHSVIFRDKVFDRIPCMKMSDFCISQVDPEATIEDESECGGYFTSTGAEKVVIGQEAPRNNYPFVLSESDGGLKCECRSFNEIRYRSTSTLYINLTPPCQTEDMDERRTMVPRVAVRIPFVDNPIALPIMFKLLGVISPDAMLDYLLLDSDPQWFKDRVLDILMLDVDALVMPREFAVARLAHDRGQSYTPTTRRKKDPAADARRRRRVETETEAERSSRQVAGLLSTEFLPHQGYAGDAVDSKTVLFGMYVRKLIMVHYGIHELDDRDHYMHRRVQLTSSLMTLLFRKHLTMWRRRLASQIRRDLDSGAHFVGIKYLLQANIGNHLSIALTSGNFSMQRGQNNMDGAAQVLSRTEPHAHVAHTNRTTNPMNKDGRAVRPRLQHASSLGVIGAWDTPEGQACGLVRNKAAMAGTRVGYPNDVLVDAVLSTGMVDASQRDVPLGRLTNCPVFVSGMLIGVCSVEPTILLKLLRDRRAVQDLPFDLSIYRTAGARATVPQGEIHVNGDPGSLWWPLLRVDRLPKLREVLDHVTNEDSLWATLLSTGVVEVINKDEEASAVRVALDHPTLERDPPGTYTHVVIHPSQICSIYEAKGPYLQYNQAPRVTYQAAMQKQAIGRELTNAKYRVDTALYKLWHVERPLVSTHMDEVLSSNGVASVQNPVVAIVCDGGYNIEDSLIFNKASIERGLFRSSATRTVRNVVRREGDTEVEILGPPPEGCRARLYANYTKINPKTGTVDPGTHVSHNDVLISKYVKMTRKVKRINERGEPEEVDEETYRDRSTIVRNREDAIVEEVIFSATLEGETSVRIKTRAVRIPEVGDKFACMTADHMVPTRDRGLVPIPEITIHDWVACFNPDTHEMEYHQPTRVLKYKAPSDLISIEALGVSQCVTRNHRLPVVETSGTVTMRCAESAVYELGEFDLMTAASHGYAGDDRASEIRAWLNTKPLELRQEWLRFWGMLVLYFAKTDHASVYVSRSDSDAIVDTFADTLDALDIVTGDASDYQLGVCCHETFPDVAGVAGLAQSDALAFVSGVVQCKANGQAHPNAPYLPYPWEHDAWLQTLFAHAGRTHLSNDTVRSVSSADVSVVTGEPVYCLTVPTGVFYVCRNQCLSLTGNSRYGQKGTMGAKYDEVDMPFNPKTGMTPDILMNPHCICSRMTIGHLIEMLRAKLAALEGVQGDGTPFSDPIDLSQEDLNDDDAVINAIGRELARYGYNPSGNETLVDGRTGKTMRSMVFTGPVAYQKLKHMVMDKYHARSRGPKQAQTQQPVEGRHNDGGQRFGEMERDNIIGHGGMALLQERLLISSDKSNVPVCMDCGEIAQPPKRNAGSTLYAATVHADKPFCHNCLSHDTVCNREMPYAYKLSVQELEALHLRSGFTFSDAG